MIVPFIFAAVAGTACDQIHVRFGLLFYPEPFLFGQAWWVPLLFGVAGIALFRAPAPIMRALLSEAPRPLSPWWDVIFAFTWFVAAYFVTGLLGKHAVWLGALLFVSWAGRVVFAAHRGPRFAKEVVALVVLSGLTAIAGPLVEHTLIRLGLFHYVRPDEVLWWLPGLYLHAALLGRSVARAFYEGR